MAKSEDLNLDILALEPVFYHCASWTSASIPTVSFMRIKFCTDKEISYLSISKKEYYSITDCVIHFTEIDEPPPHYTSRAVNCPLGRMSFLMATPGLCGWVFECAPSEGIWCYLWAKT